MSLRGWKVFVLSFLLYRSLSRFGTLLYNMMEPAHYGYVKNTFLNQIWRPNIVTVEGTLKIRVPIYWIVALCRSHGFQFKWRFGSEIRMTFHSGHFALWKLRPAVFPKHIKFPKPYIVPYSEPKINQAWGRWSVKVFWIIFGLAEILRFFKLPNV